jgi:glycosyltransferase involved in cell wall biosynthesis
MPAPITILMPVYNAERYLASTLESILAQTYADFHFLIIDDGSTDSSLAVLRRYARHDLRIRLISRENRGYVQSINEGIELSRGEYIARMDADDIALPGRLESQLKYMEMHPEVVCLGGYYDLIDQHGRFLTTMTPPTEHEAIEEELLAGHTPICHPCAMLRREAVERVGNYDVSMTMADDLDLWLRLGEIGKLANLPFSILQYRLHPKSVSGQAGLKQRQVARAACEMAYNAAALSGCLTRLNRRGRFPTAARATSFRFSMDGGRSIAAGAPPHFPTACTA